MRYLIQRLEQNKQESGSMDHALLHQFQRAYPDVYLCSIKVLDYLKKQYGWVCSDDEELYLCMHIKRVAEHNELE